jgi:protein-tyrosine phosphatase
MLDPSPSAPPSLLAESQRLRLGQFGVSCAADIHCHCLPGVDDGPATLDESLALCRVLVNDGITTVVATPHQLGSYTGRNLASAVRATVAELNQRLAEQQVPLTVKSGGDVRVDEQIGQLLERDQILTLADGGRYLLLELPHETFMDPLPLLKQLATTREICPIISHPERNRSLVARPNVVDSWLECGATLQLTSGSFAGDFGATAQRAAWYWLETGAAGLVASDAHDTKSRPPRMTAAIEMITHRLGHDVARRVCLENPARVIEGLELETPKRLDEPAF